MRSVRAVMAAACLLLFGIPTRAQKPPSIPTHPGELHFDRQPIEIPDADGLIHRLSTGTPVVVVEDHALPLVEVTIALRVGRYLDPPERPGLAELTGAMVRRGGSTLRSADEIDEAIAFLGTEIDSRTGLTRAGVSLDCLSESLEESLALLFELVATPGFQADRLESARSSIRSSLAARNDDPIDLLEGEWDRLLHGEEHFRARLLSETQLEAIERADLERFHRRTWRPETAVIAVSGDISTPEILALLETHVTAWQAAAGPAVDEPPVWPPADGATPQRGAFLVAHPTPQSKVSLGHELPRARNWMSQEAMTVAILNEILGGTAGQISRINGRLRGREGLVYRALSEIALVPDQRGLFRIFLDATPDNVARAVEICLEEIERIQTTPVSDRAVSIVQQEFLSRLRLRFDSADDIAGYFAEDLLLGRPHDYWYDYAARVRAVKPADVQRAARRYLRPRDLTILAVGNPQPVRTAAIRDRRLAKVLADAVLLPSRDPLSLEPQPEPNGR